jgi:tetrathionate reductase subunit B
MENAVPMGYFRAKVSIADTGEFPDAKRYFLPKMCNHCDAPPCVESCPVEGATYKRDDGTVVVERDKCIGCGNCIDDCPYGARFLHPFIPITNDPKPYAAKEPGLKGKKKSDLRVADKCDYCLPRLDAGIEEPACVRNCAGKARYFGDVNDPESQISKLIKDNKTSFWDPDSGTEPAQPFIAPDGEVFDVADGEINSQEEVR